MRADYGACTRRSLWGPTDHRPRRRPSGPRASWRSSCDARVHVVTAFRPTSELFFHPEFAALPSDIHEQIDPAGGAREIAERAVGMLPNDVQGEAYAVTGAAADVLCDIAVELGADLIVVGNRGMTGARRRARVGAELGDAPRDVRRAHRPHGLSFRESRPAR